MCTSEKFSVPYWAQITPNHEAVCDERYSLTYGQLDRYARSLSAYLTEKGLAKGERLMICLPSCCEVPVVFAAAERIGAVVVPASHLYKEKDLEYIVNLAAPTVAIVAESETERILLCAAPQLKTILIDVNGPSCAFEDFPPCDTELPVDACGNDPALVVCTSGSTGKPKGVMLSHSNLSVPAADIIERFRMSSDDTVFVPIPLCHMFGIMGMTTTFNCGARLVITRKFNAEKALRILEAEEVSVQFCVPTIYEREIDAYSRADEKPLLPKLRTGMIAGASSIKRSISYFDEMFGCKLLNSYGMTEASGLIMADLDDPKEIRYSKGGRPCRHAEVKIVKDDGTQAGPGEVGEILCRGPSLMLGYYHHDFGLKDPRTADGWFKTGDLGKCDVNGVYTITGRKKDIIIRGGYNVVPIELENLYYDSGMVSDVCAIGYPDKELGERIAVYVVLKDSVSAAPEELRTYAAENLPKFKVPDIVIPTENIPKLPNGKTDKLLLKSLASPDNNAVSPAATKGV